MMRSKMVFLIAAQFFRTAFKNKAVVGLTILIGLMLLMATIIGWNHFRQQQDIRSRYRQLVREQWEANPDKHPHRMAHYGHFAFRPKHPLSFFDFGMENYTGVSVFLEAHKQNPVNFSEAGFSTGILRFGEISMAMILQLLVPLLLLFLGFNTISVLRENGTLKMMLTQGVNWQELIMGKTLGVTAVAFVLYAPVMLLTVFLWLVLSRFSASTDEVWRLALLLLSYFLYFIIWSLIAVLVSAFSRTSKGSLTTLIGIWLLLVIVLPRGAQAMGAQRYPSPSKAAFEAALHVDLTKEGDSHNPDDPHFRRLKDSLLKAHNVKSTEQLPFNYSGFIMYKGEEITANIHNRHQQRLIKTYENQNSFNRYTGFVNPYIAMKNFSMALTGADFASYRDFQDQAETYRYQLAQRLNTLQMEHISNRKPGPEDKPYTISSRYWKDLPDFDYQFRGSGFVLQNEVLSVVALLFWIGLLLLLLFTVTKRFKAI
jgi:ABC-2 type transport system permease protein